MKKSERVKSHYEKLEKLEEYKHHIIKRKKKEKKVIYMLHGTVRTDIPMPILAFSFFKPTCVTIILAISSVWITNTIVCIFTHLLFNQVSQRFNKIQTNP